MPASPPPGARPRVLSIAGSDPSGGAGIQADLKTFTAFGCYGQAVVTALTAQDTTGVHGVTGTAAPFVASCLDAVLRDCPPVASKTGMLFDPEVIACVAERAARRLLGPLVVDPVMVATSGDRLLLPEAIETLRSRLLPHATLVTPNAAEAEVLAEHSVRSLDEAREAARAILALGPGAVLVKGGHLPGDTVADLLVTRSGRERLWLRPRLDVRSPHGCGCTLSAAIASGLALGRPLEVAVERAGDFVHAALAAARPIGRGATPLDHCVTREGGW